jgi:dihydrofolate synthase/folylpolyglutamate synthase
VWNGRAAELECPVTRTSDWTVSNLSLDPRGSRFHLSGERHLRIHCPLAGEHQVENAATAAAALVRLGVPDDAIERGIASVRWPARLERVSENPEIILDGAHNPAGARALAAYIDRFYSARRVRLIYGAMRDKAVAEIGGILFPRAQQVILTAPHQPRAFSPLAMREFADHPGVRVAPDIEAALALVRDATPEDVVFVTGSLFLVAEARALLSLPLTQ